MNTPCNDEGLRVIFGVGSQSKVGAKISIIEATSSPGPLGAKIAPFPDEFVRGAETSKLTLFE